MALERFLKLPPEKREHMLQTAAHMFAKDGYDGTSYNELLREIGMGKSQAYYYFQDKADFFITVIAAVYEGYYELVSDLPVPRSKEEYWRHVEKLHLLGFDYQADSPIAGPLSLAALRSSVRFALADALVNGEGTTREQHRYWLQQGRELGAVRTDLPDDLLVEMSINQALFVDEWFASHHLNSSAKERRQLARQFTDVTKRMFQP